MLLVPLLLLLAGGEAARILVIAPMPMRSHMNVVTAVTRALAARGHHITFVCSEPVADYVRKSNDNVISIGNPGGEQMTQIFEYLFKGWMNSWVGALVGGFVGSVAADAVLGHPDFQAEINKPGARFDLVMAETIFGGEGLLGLAHKFDAQVVSISAVGTFFSLNLGVGNPMNPAWVPDPLMTFTNRMSLYQRTVNTLFSAYQYGVYKVVNLPRQQAVASQYFPDAPPVTELLRTRLALTLINSHFSLFYPIPMSPNCVEVGGMHIQEIAKPLPKDLKDFMDGAENGVVLFSMGSNLKLEFMPEGQVEAILGALGSLNQSVLLKWDGPPRKVSSNIRIAEWLPQADLLAHPNIRAFVTHGGLLSTQEAVFHGVPIVGIPVFGDQLFNMELAVNKGFAAKVDLFSITTDSMTNALKEVLENPKYSKTAKHLSALFRAKPQRPVFWVEHVLAHGGDHLRPSSVDLALYQVLLLDVLLALLTPVLLLGLCCWAACRRRRSRAASVGSDKKKTD